MMAAEFKVSVESLHTTKVKEINYDGEEIYEEKPSLSKRLSYLAQRVNFEEGDEREENTTPAAKKSTRKRPWEFTHSKLKQALTEVSVLSDVLNIIQSNRQYISLDRIYSERATLPPLYQYNIKKKALEVAAGILKRGAEPFKRSRSHGDYEFHKTLHDLRKRWILRRTLSNVCGDLSYHSAGSLYTQSVQFEVHKGTEGSGNILSVVVPQELRGQSEIIIFLADKPVRKVGMINSLLPTCFVELRKRRMLLTSWEQKLVSAQNVLFNEELFAQLTKEAFEQRSNLQGEVLTDRINIPLSMDMWLSVLLIREYEGIPLTYEPSEDLPQPNWELTVALKQLLRDNHRYVTTPRPPRPSNANFNASLELREAGAAAYSSSELKQLEYDFSVYNKLIKMAKHLNNERKLIGWLEGLSQSSTDPAILLVITPSLSLTVSSFTLAFTCHGFSIKWKTEIILKDDAVSFKQPSDGQLVTIPVDEQRITGTLKRQCVLYLTKLIEESAISKGWDILYSSTLPQPSMDAFKRFTDLMLASSSLLMESSSGDRRLELLIEYGHVTASVSHVTHSVDIRDGLDRDHITDNNNNIISLIPSSDNSLVGGIISLMDSVSS